MIIIFLGGASNTMASFELITRFPSISIPGKDLGRAPVAMIILCASIISVFLPFFTSSVVFEVSFPVPEIWEI